MYKLLSKIFILTIFTALLACGYSIWHPAHTKADFVSNDVMDDNIFDYANSMTAAQIDGFLNNNFPSSCISTKNGFSAPDVTGYSPNPSQFFYSSTPVTAGTVVYDAAQAYGINPQVLLATLQKEESLVSGTSGCSILRYTSAVGYGCPDSQTSNDYSYPSGGLLTPLYYINGNPVNSVTGSCVNSGPKAGFSEQIIHAAWLLTFNRHKSEGETGWAVIKGNWNNCDDNDTCPAAWNIPASYACYSGFMTQGNFKRCPTDTNAVYYDGYATIDGTSVHMDNGATASFYVYTPHFAGNQSFDNIFSGWFGPVRGSLAQAYGDSTVYLLDGVTAYPIYDVNILNDLYPLGPVRQTSTTEINNYSLGGVAQHIYKDSNGTIYLVNSGIKLAFPDCNMVADYGYNCGNALTLSDSQLAKFANGPPVTHLLKGVNTATVYYIENGQKRPIPTWNEVQGFKIPYLNWLSDAYVNQIPTSPAVAYGPGSLVKTPNDSSVYVVKDSDNIYPLTNFLYTQELGLGTSVRTIISYYTLLGSQLLTKVQCSGNYYIGTNSTTYQVSPSIMTAYGFKTADFMDIGSTCLNLPISSQPLGQFIRTVTGAIFYVTGGQKQYVTTYAVYQAHGGNSSNTIQVSNYFLNMVPDGPDLSS